MLEKKILSRILLATAILSLIIVSSITGSFTYAQSEKFNAKLKGTNEIPPVNTTATGKVNFNAKDGAIRSKINLTGITNVTGAHIYFEGKSHNGMPVVDLLRSGQENKTQDRLIITGEINPTAFEGPMTVTGKTMTDLLKAMGSGSTYVNVQTIDHPGGELRGKIKVSGSNATQTVSANATNMTATLVK